MVGRSRWRSRRGGLVVMVSLVALALGFTAPPATAGGSYDDGEPRVTVMTRNLYLGADLSPALAAQDVTEFLAAVAKIYGQVQFTDFPARAQALADEIAENRPDLIGLQEVSRWETAGPGAPPTLDFLTVLSSALAARGLDYEVAAVARNAEIGPVPLVAPCDLPTPGACTVKLTDRDVILVNQDRRGLYWWNARSGRYATQAVLPTPVGPLSFDRGWASIDGWLRGESFHFANTHLETEDFPEIQVAQAREFLAGPAYGRGVDIAVGDFNSAADGSTTKTYRLLTDRFTDAWRVNRGDKGYTCCQNGTLTNPTSLLSSRIDLVLSRGDARPLSARLVGDRPFQDFAPLYPSDHAGVVATLRLND